MDSAFVVPIALRKSRFSSSKAVSSSSATARVGKVYKTLRAPIVKAISDDIGDQLAWVDAIDISEIQPGSLYRRVVYGLDIVIACAFDGQVYALGNKGTPLGVPLSSGSIVSTGDSDYLKCPQYGTLYNLQTGEVKDEESWVPSPFIISKILRALFPEPLGVPAYEVREFQGNMQILLNIKARAQYEQKYWKGLLDASGKADGGYY